MSDIDVPGLAPREAWELMQRDPRATLIDIRSTLEYLFVGHPKPCIHIPWIDEPDWKVNPEFVTLVRKVMLGGLSCADENDCAPVLLICRSGHRSREAGQALIRSGVPGVHNVLEGFEGDLDEDHHRSTRGGWRFHGLPWEQC